MSNISPGFNTLRVPYLLVIVVASVEIDGENPLNGNLQ